MVLGSNRMTRVWAVAGVSIGVVAGVGALPADAVSGSSPVFRKPFLEAGTAKLGGYIDMEFVVDPETSTFDQHRFVPFIYAEVSEWVHVASEIEFEHGGSVSGDGGDGEIKLEFATMDLTLSEGLNFRGGVILSPLGRLNVHHDSPMLDLTDRPIVTRRVVPTTLSESGLGFYGTLYPSELTVLDYEVYLVNGFSEDVVSGGRLDMRAGRGSQSSDNNNHRSIVGRLGFSPRLGLNLGVSGHVGAYDDQGEERLTVVAFDGQLAHGPFELLGEGAVAKATIGASVEDPTPGTAPTDAGTAGFYAEARYHLFSGAVSRFPQSVFTAVARLDHVDRDTEADGALEQRITLGLNFRPTEDSVFKNDLVFGRTKGVEAGDWDDFEVGYRFSMATYF